MGKRPARRTGGVRGSRVNGNRAQRHARSLQRAAGEPVATMRRVAADLAVDLYCARPSEITINAVLHSVGGLRLCFGRNKLQRGHTADARDL